MASREDSSSAFLVPLPSLRNIFPFYITQPMVGVIEGFRACLFESDLFPREWIWPGSISYQSFSLI